jgi:hypothetical protein
MRRGERWLKVPQLGRVLIGNDVEIGACTIDRGALDDGDRRRVKLDNLIMVAHNVRIGAILRSLPAWVSRQQPDRSAAIGGAAMIGGHVVPPTAYRRRHVGYQVHTPAAYSVCPWKSTELLKTPPTCGIWTHGKAS